MNKTRTETDTFGPIEVPVDRYWGAQTERARHNFQVGEETMPVSLIRALAIVKRAAAETNRELKLLDARRARAIIAAAQEVIDGKLAGNFPLSIWQSGSGTQTNMNVNEVIANRANEMLGGKRGDKEPIHPNDHVNMSQSTNDAFPTAMHIAAADQIAYLLDPALAHLQGALEVKVKEFASIIKIGRTHTQDATPLTLGQEFSGYAAQVKSGIGRMRLALKGLYPLAQGGTAVGTGLNAPKDFDQRMCVLLSAATGLQLRPAANHFEAQAARDDCVEVAGQLAAMVASLTKLANDVRLLGSGPRAGLAELRVPAVQPGSSIMPGKVNPVMSEMLIQVGLYANGLLHTVMACGREGQLELNATLPLMSYCLHEAIACLARGAQLFATRCIAGLTADVEHCAALAEHSLMLVTALTPQLGYDVAASLAEQAQREGQSLRTVILARGLMGESEIERLLNPLDMTTP